MGGGERRQRMRGKMFSKTFLLTIVDEKIVGMIEDPKELEKEIFQTEDIK